MKAVDFFALCGLVQPRGSSPHMFSELFITSLLPAGLPCHVPLSLQHKRRASHNQHETSGPIGDSAGTAKQGSPTWLSIQHSDPTSRNRPRHYRHRRHGANDVQQKHPKALLRVETRMHPLQEGGGHACPPKLPL